jgi:hypothetical protein
MTLADIANAVWGVLLVVIGFSILRRRRPIGTWDYRPFGALAVFIGAIGLAFAVAAVVAQTS